VPYQLDTFVSPAFPGYISGHSAFSRAAAEVLTLLTGSPFFPGGLGEYHFTANEYLRFEVGPTTDVTLQWATYYDAADQAGLSRIFGGIHPAIDDFNGRRVGAQVGLTAFLKADQLRHGAAAPRGLVNISSRGRSGAGEQAMIAGFVVDGDDTQRVLVRAVGPELHTFGIPLELCEPDPSLRLFRSEESEPFLFNDNWGYSPRAVDIAAHAGVVGAFPLAADGPDAAELVDLAPGVYTVVTTSADSAREGIALAEVYGNRLANISTRGRVGAGEQVLIAGFSVEAHETLPVLVRGVGPSLAGFGVGGTLEDPRITLYRRNANGTSTALASNDDWFAGDQQSLLEVAALETGAFPLVPGSRDAALMAQLPPGLYTVVISGGGDAEGIALAEVYHVRF
jgi:hypothetical protein